MAAASTARKSATDKMRQSGNAAADTGTRILRDTKDAATRTLEARRSQAEAYLEDVGRAIDAAADQFTRDNHPTSAHYLRAAARHGRHFAKSFDPQDLRSLVERAEEIIRTRPVVTTVAALALGFATMQAIRATPQQRTSGGYIR